jgi:polysaccharide pyruvyl transferase WcaK-like protein
MGPSRKIGVLTFHKCINYGSYWQARCLVEGLRGRGYDAELLDHDDRQVTIAELRCAFQPKLPERSHREDLRSYGTKTRRFYNALAALPLSHPFSLHEPQALEGYDTIIIGSDEVWNLSHPWYGGKPIFYGVGLKAPRLISYAASFGNYSCHWGIEDYWADQLKRFDAVSVRDENSYWLVRGATSREAELVLDPVLQFPEVARADSAAADPPYALVYGHGFPPWLQQRVVRWSRSHEVKLLSVGYRNQWADEHQIAAGPAEFASLMAGASAVITNFFHGCVFALANGKPLVTAPSAYRFNKVRDLAAALGAERHVVAEDASEARLAPLLAEPPGEAVADRIEELRQRSSAFLDASLR